MKILRKPKKRFLTRENFKFKTHGLQCLNWKNSKKIIRENNNLSVKIINFPSVKNFKQCVKKLFESVRETCFLTWKFWNKSCVKTVSLRETSEKNAKNWLHARVFFSRRKKKHWGSEAHYSSDVIYEWTLKENALSTSQHVRNFQITKIGFSDPESDSDISDGSKLTIFTLDVINYTNGSANVREHRSRVLRKSKTWQYLKNVIYGPEFRYNRQFVKVLKLSYFLTLIL